MNNIKAAAVALFDPGIVVTHQCFDGFNLGVTVQIDFIMHNADNIPNPHLNSTFLSEHVIIEAGKD